MRTAIVEQRLTEIRETLKSLSGKLSSVDHKENRVRYAAEFACELGPLAQKPAIYGTYTDMPGLGLIKRPRARHHGLPPHLAMKEGE